MALSETWLINKDTNASIAASLPSGYQFYHLPRLNRTGGGVGFLAHDNITCTVVKSPTFNSFEHLVVNCKFKGRSVNFVSVYRPPGQANQFLKDFTSFFDFLLALSPEPVLIGDFNIDPVKHASTYVRYIELLGGFNLTQHVAVLTHIHGGVLDHFITFQVSDLLDKKIVMNDCLSDHMCPLACLNANVNPSSQSQILFFQRV